MTGALIRLGDVVVVEGEWGHLHVDYTTSVDDVRAEFERIVKASALWDGNVAILQVVEATERKVRAGGRRCGRRAPSARSPGSGASGR